MQQEYCGRNCFLSSIVVLTVFLYATATPLQKRAAQNKTLNLAIENFEIFPLQIVSAKVADISAPTERTKDVTAHLINPKIVLKNNSDRAVSVYVLEFRKAGLEPFYLTCTNDKLVPQGIDSIETNSPNTFLWAGEKKATGTGDRWTVRIDAVLFKDGSVVTLHGWPAPSRRQPIRGGQVLEGKLIKRVEPIYPLEAKRVGVQGQVVMQLTFDEKGNVTEVKVEKGHPLLNDAALEAVKQWKYSPTLLNGEPVSVIVSNVMLDFKLE